MNKTTLLFKKFRIFFIAFFSGAVGYAQCPENITVAAADGQCGAAVSYTIGGSGGPSANGVINGSATDGTTGWDVVNGGDGWITSGGYFVSSYDQGSMSQVIDLTSMSLTDEYMDSQPAITVSEDYVGWTVNYADSYSLTVELRGENNNVIATYATGNITTSATVQTASHVFTGYGTGVRKVYIYHTGQDIEYWAGNYGAAVTNVQLTVDMPATGTVEQTAGLASGAIFPIGTTTNTFEITDADENVTTCSFDVTVIDTEPPLAVVMDNITVALGEDGTASLLIADVDGGSTDNCNIAPLMFSLDIQNFTCDNLGDNTVTLTVTDNSGNISTAVANVTVEDPGNYCQVFGVHDNQFKDLQLYPNPTNGVLTIDAAGFALDKVEVYDMCARLVKTIAPESASATISADISALNSGIYFVKLYSGKKVAIEKVVKL